MKKAEPGSSTESSTDNETTPSTAQHTVHQWYQRKWKDIYVNDNSN